MTQRLVSLLLASALVLGAPGYGAYEAAAQAFRASGAAAPVLSGGWGQALGRLASSLEQTPALASGSGRLLGVLGHLRLELAIAPKSPGTLTLVRHIPLAVAADAAAFARLPAEAQAGLAAAAVEAATNEVSAEAEALLGKARQGTLSEADRKAVRALAGAWFYLPSETAGEFRRLSRGLEAPGKLALARGIARRLGAGPAAEETASTAVTAETRHVLAGLERFTLARPAADRAQSALLVRDMVAPYAVRALDEAAGRVAERGHDRAAFWSNLLRAHGDVFGRLAGRKLVDALREHGTWTDLVSAISLHAADRLAAIGSAEALQALREAGADSDLGFRLPAWDARSQRHASVARWLAAEHGAPEGGLEARYGRQVGSLSGVPLRLSAKVLRPAGLMAATFLFAFHLTAPGLGWAPHAAQAVLSTVLMFAGILAHELGHARAAQAFGLPVLALALTGKGGGALIDSSMRRSRVEALVSAAGPLVSAAFAAACLLAASWLPASLAWLTAVLVMQGWVNVVGVVTNALPVLPSDGGRVLRALLAGRMKDHYRATRLASAIGVAAALGLAASAVPAGLLVGWWLAPLVALAGLSLVPRAWSQRLHPGTVLVDEDPAARG